MVTEPETKAMGRCISANQQLNNLENLSRLISKTLVKRNITVKQSNGKYMFTKAYRFFIDFARDLLESDNNNSLNH